MYKIVKINNVLSISQLIQIQYPIPNKQLI